MAHPRGLYRRGRIWWLSYVDGSGRRRLESSRSDKQGVAQALLDRRRAAAQVGESPARDARVTMVALVDRYEAAVKHQPSYLPVRKHLLEQVRKRFGMLPVARLGTYELQRWQSELLAHGRLAPTARALLRKGKPAEAAKVEGLPMKPASVNKLIGQVKAIVARAVEWGMATPAQLAAVRRVRQLAEDKRLRYLSPEEAQRLLDKCPIPLRWIVGLSLYTGCRPGELLGLRWDQVDLEQGLLLLPKTKTGRREIHLSSRAVEILEGVRDYKPPKTRRRRVVLVKSPYVFHRAASAASLKRISKGFRAAAARAELKGVTPYTLRHTFASWLVQEHEGLRTVQELLGHAKAQTTMRYAHLGREDLQAAVERLAAKRKAS